MLFHRYLAGHLCFRHTVPAGEGWKETWGQHQALLVSESYGNKLGDLEQQKYSHAVLEKSEIKVWAGPVSLPGHQERKICSRPLSSS